MSDFTELYKAVKKDAEAQPLELCGRSYTTREVCPVLAPTPEPLLVSTLSAVADYLNLQIDEGKRGNIFVRVGGPAQVLVQSHVCGDFMERRTFINACPDLPDCLLGFEGKWLDQEYFQILLQAGFAGPGAWAEGMPLNGKAAVLRYVSKVQSKATATLSDDGTAQAVVLQAGVSSAVSKLPNPVMLAPFRTFPEVEQPESPFVFRISERDGGIRYSLTEADGGAWRIEAVKRVAEWLKAHIKPELQIPVLY